MGQIKEHHPVMLIVAVTSRYDQAFEWADETLQRQWGPIAKRSPRFDFNETEYYHKTMGTDLKKQFLAFEHRIEPSRIAETKHISNRLETEFAQQYPYPQERPLNIDPGYISEAKLVLATTKDRDHRIYLQDGIYAEVTLHFRGKGWIANRWTYPDYQRSDFQDFFTECRQWLRKK